MLTCTNVFMLLTGNGLPLPSFSVSSWKTREAEIEVSLLRIQASLRGTRPYFNNYSSFSASSVPKSQGLPCPC